MATEIIWHQKQFFYYKCCQIFYGGDRGFKKTKMAPNLTVFVQAETVAMGIFAFFSDAAIIALDAGKHFKLNGKIVAQYALC